MNGRILISAVLATFTASPLYADQFRIEVSGTVSSVHEHLSSTFSIGDPFIYSATVDYADAYDLHDSRTDIDATRLDPIQDNGVYAASMSFGANYSAAGFPSDQRFWDKWGSNSQQVYFSVQSGIDAPDVAGYPVGALNILWNIPYGTFTPNDDPDDIISEQDLMNLSSADIGNLSISLSFQAPYELQPVAVQATPTSVTVTNVSEPERLPFVYLQQEGLSDFNGNGYPELANLRSNRLGNFDVVVVDAFTGNSISRVPFFSSRFDIVSLAVLGDMTGNGIQEISVMARNKSNGRYRTLVKDADTGELVSRFDFTP